MMERFKVPLQVIAWYVVVVVLMGAGTWGTHRFYGVIGGAAFMAVVIAVWL